MDKISFWIYLFFSLSVLFTFFILVKASRLSRAATAVLSVWLILQGWLGARGFYIVSGGIPPRFSFLLLPPLSVVVVFVMTGKGHAAIRTMNPGLLTLLQTVRFPIEIILYQLMLHNVLPRVMTFEGRNFDIVCGITAPLVYYFGFVKHNLGRRILVSWNLICVFLLGNIVVTAVLSAPFRFQQFGFDHPNIALFYFPFIWLPCFVVPVALFSHLVVLRQLLTSPGRCPD